MVIRVVLIMISALVLWTPVSAFAQENGESDEVIDLRARVRILSPKPGMVGTVKSVDVVVSGPAGDPLVVKADGAELAEGQFGDDGRFELQGVPFEPRSGELQIEVTAREDSDPETVVVAVYRTPRWEGTPQVIRTNSELDLAAGLTTISWLVAVLGSMVVMETVRGPRWFDVWTVSTLYMGAISVPASLSVPGPGREVDPWVSVLVSTLTTSAFVGTGEAIRRNGGGGWATLFMFSSVFFVPVTSIGLTYLFSEPTPQIDHGPRF